MSIQKNSITSKKALLFLTIVFSGTIPAHAQQYDIPYASQGNTIQLEIINTGEYDGMDLKVVAIDIPDWIQLNQTEITLSNLAPNQTETATFTFDATEETVVGETSILRFHILESEKVIGKREFNLKSEAPATFELFNNYPNPFNPTTTISYQLPESMHVKVRIYNILGQHISTLVNSKQLPGKHLFKWDASQFSSGIYLYSFQGKTPKGKIYSSEEKMLLIK